MSNIGGLSAIFHLHIHRGS